MVNNEVQVGLVYQGKREISWVAAVVGAELLRTRGLPESHNPFGPVATLSY